VTPFKFNSDEALKPEGRTAAAFWSLEGVLSSRSR